MTRVKRQDNRRSPGERREALFAAALSLFAERGFYGTNVPQLLQLANVSAGAMYGHFESKEALVNALYQRCLQERSDALWGSFPEQGPFRKQYSELLRRLAGFASQRA